MTSGAVAGKSGSEVLMIVVALELRKIAGMLTCTCRGVWGWALELHAFGVVLLCPVGGARCDPLFAGSLGWTEWNGLSLVVRSFFPPSNCFSL
jgi:hypothetical protein